MQVIESTYAVTLRYYPEEHGGSIAGNLTVIDVDSETGRVRGDPVAAGHRYGRPYRS